MDGVERWLREGRPRRKATLFSPHPHLTPTFPPPSPSYPKLAHDVGPGTTILCADGSIVLEVLSTDKAAGTVRARCMNTAMLG